jgi:hypothetical protein
MVMSFLENAFDPESTLQYLLMSNSWRSIDRLHSLFTPALELVGNWKNTGFIEEFCVIVSSVVVAQAPMTILAIYWSPSRIEMLIIHYPFISSVSPSAQQNPAYQDSPHVYYKLSHRPQVVWKQAMVYQCTRSAPVSCTLLPMPYEGATASQHIWTHGIPFIKWGCPWYMPACSELHSRVPCIQYACQHFVIHLHLLNVKLSDLEGLSDVEFFMGSQLLFWLEALSLVGKNKMAILAMETLEQWCWVYQFLQSCFYFKMTMT